MEDRIDLTSIKKIIENSLKNLTYGKKNPIYFPKCKCSGVFMNLRETVKCILKFYEDQISSTKNIYN